ncbi:MAG: helix-turn-helix transcriptional regulator [Betaproteobacteria bacterium]|nr:helix-turn-helix transcriptional regulator [Betaproteobacteria bacterium]
MLDSNSEAATHAEDRIGLRVASMGRFPPRAVRRAIEYIHANLAGDLRLENIAGAAGQSVFHFSRTFRNTTGLAPHRYLPQARIERVKALLLESDRSLAAIAEESGFSDQSHMSKVFRRLTGATPKTFRSKWRKKCCLRTRTP